MGSLLFVIMLVIFGVVDNIIMGGICLLKIVLSVFISLRLFMFGIYKLVIMFENWSIFLCRLSKFVLDENVCVLKFFLVIIDCKCSLDIFKLLIMVKVVLDGVELVVGRFLIGFRGSKILNFVLILIVLVICSVLFSLLMLCLVIDKLIFVFGKCWLVECLL